MVCASAAAQHLPVLLEPVTAAARWPETLARFDAEDPHVRPTGGETFAELEARVREALTDLCARHAADAKLAVVAHGGVLAAVTGRFGHANAEAVELDWPA